MPSRGVWSATADWWSLRRGEVADRLLPRTRALHEDFQECPDCGRVYWQGSHHAQLQVIVDEITGKSVRATGDGDR